MDSFPKGDGSGVRDGGPTELGGCAAENFRYSMLIPSAGHPQSVVVKMA